MSDEARREMQQRALRNVRGLVDRIEEDDKLEARKQRRILAWVIIGLVVVATVLGLGLARHKDQRVGSADAAATKPKPGQVMPQAPRASQ